MSDVFDAAAQTQAGQGDVFDQAAKTPVGSSATSEPEGFIGSVLSDVGGLAKGAANMLPPVAAYNAVKQGINEFGSLRDTGKTLEQRRSGEQQKAGYGPVYRNLTPLAEGVGVNVSGMENAASQGDTAGVIGHAAVPLATLAAGEAAAHVAPKLGNLPGVRNIRELYKPLRDVNVGTIDVRTGQSSPLPGPTSVDTVQPIVQKGIRDVVANTAKDAGVPASKASSIRDVIAETAEGVRAKSQPVFQKLDELSKGQFSDAQAKAVRYRGALDKAGKDAYAEALAKQDKIFDTYKDQFDPGAFIKAKADWRQYRAMQEVDQAIKDNTRGQRPELTAKAASEQPAEELKVSNLSTTLHKLYNEGTLETALGKQGADDLLTHVGSAEKQIDVINAKNKQMVSENAARNKRVIEQNQAKNAAIVQANTKANEAQLFKRRLVTGAAGLAGVGGAEEVIRRTLSRKTQ